ncbi:S-layer homology domain-containing protein, partial [Ureibacillus sinduriensis]
MKRLMPKLALTTLLISTTTVPTLAADTSFSDIQNTYAKDAILQLAEAGILNGKGDGKFDPTGKITRQDFAIILAKALNLDVDNSPQNPTFSDLPVTHYSYKYVEAAAQAGLIKGVGDGNFGAGQNLSREQMAVLFVRALGVDATDYGNKLTFADADKIAGYAKDAVGFAVEAQLLNGYNNTFDPKGNADRQAVAQVASKFLKVKDEIAPTPEPEAPPVTEPTPVPVKPPVVDPRPNPTAEPPTSNYVPNNNLNTAILRTKIENATSLLNGIKIGEDIGQVARVDYNALLTAISIAQSIYENSRNKTQEELNSATISLENAMNAFNNSVVKAGNANQLNEKIGAANSKLANVLVGDGVGQVAEVDLAALASAIEKAEGI